MDLILIIIVLLLIFGGGFGYTRWGYGGGIGIGGILLIVLWYLFVGRPREILISAVSKSHRRPRVGMIFRQLAGLRFARRTWRCRVHHQAG